MLQTDAVLEKANDLKRQGVSFALATVVRCESPTSAKPGAKAIIDTNGEIDGWIGGGCAQPAVIATAKKALKDGQPRLIRVSPTKDAVVEEGIIDFGMTCHSGGTLDIFIEPVMARPALLIIGGAPSAQVLSVLANRLGFAVTAACPGGDADMFPEATHHIDSLDLTGIATPPFVVVATQGKRDEEGLEAALASGAPYIAFIASERKAEKLRTYLKERGHDATRVDAIISPAGIEIGAVTPEEIALSVLAAVVKVRRDAGVEMVSAHATEAQLASQTQQSGSCCSSHATQSQPESETATQASAIDPVCGMNVDIATTEYKSVYEGQTYYFCCAGCQHSFEKTPQQYLTSREGSA